jgi:hypothetical protein|tara:strand:- start:2546 stop:2812 length:267 start_codon:yes stop_codon:yes gene_type:complete
MSFAFFIVGAAIFSLYVWFTLWMIFDQNKKQREEGNGTQGYYERHQPDSIDLDGMGDQGRIPYRPRVKAVKRKKGSQSRMKNYNWKDK